MGSRSVCRRIARFGVVVPKVRTFGEGSQRVARQVAYVDRLPPLPRLESADVAKAVRAYRQVHRGRTRALVRDVETGCVIVAASALLGVALMWLVHVLR